MYVNAKPFQVVGATLGLVLCQNVLCAREPTPSSDLGPGTWDLGPGTWDLFSSTTVSKRPSEWEEQIFPDLSKVPEVYLDLKEVFSKARATSLPPHRLYNCAIDLVPSTTPPFLGFIVSVGHIQMDPAKAEVVKDWPVPESRKALQQFLHFANFYRPFIHGYRSIASPLHQLTSSKKLFILNPEAQAAFSRLKDHFSSAPILTLPDSRKQFFVEVDALDLGMGVVLYQ
ncbi:hypothetical protein QTP70_012637 [Hemibagrus guttatus]|uniref:Reverse transcriptase/retrotransposon-derived protein RNase H-like domain-containing protein n=1 Tax=Hemibagrus guttatus TaxID=175788 RepID=A0AAE0RBZ5_9TELE|nr:hypothetical protein QTP70_012637 [Hemibagrus guttatus]